MSEGWAALASALYLKKRNETVHSPASISYVLLGTGLLWFGWFGFNAGSALGGILVLYGIVATFQTASFGRVYAAYGGIFIILALLWGWKIDGFKPDKYDILGALIALIGACIIIYM